MFASLISPTCVRQSAACFQTQTLVIAVGVMVALGALSASADAQTGITTQRKCLPPQDQNACYLGQFHALYSFPGGAVQLTKPAHRIFNGPCQAPPARGQTTTHSFDSVIEADATVTGKGRLHLSAPAKTTVIVTSVPGIGKTQVFTTEMTELAVKGGNLPPGWELRRSPTRRSLGQTSITSLPSGKVRVRSYFIVNTELSMDGKTWIPSVSKQIPRMTLAACVPPPSPQPNPSAPQQ